MRSKPKTLFYLSCLLLLFSCRKAEDPASYYKDGDVSKLYFNDSKGINIVVLGDGFTKEDLKKGGAYDAHVKQAIDQLFTVSPYKEYKNYFNTYVVYAESKQRGVNAGYDPDNTKTRYNAYFSGGNTGLLYPGNYDTCYKYVNKAVPIQKAHLVVMIVNDNSLDAATGGSIATITTSTFSKRALVHESGHSFASLGDEYISPEIANNYSTDAISTMANLDTTGNTEKVKWAHFLKRSAYKSTVGIFEGGYYRAKGVYRPEESSLMRDASGILHFNAPSREAIVRRIDQIMGIPFDLEKFIADDVLSIHPISVAPVGKPRLLNDFIIIKPSLK